MIRNNNKVCEVFKAFFLKFLKKFFDCIVNTFYSIIHLKEKDAISVSKKYNACKPIQHSSHFKNHRCEKTLQKDYTIVYPSKFVWQFVLKG